MTNTPIASSITVMACYNDPEGGEILRSYYSHDAERERRHFIDAVIQQLNDDINHTISLYQDDENENPEQYLTYDRAHLAAVQALKEEFIRTGRASQDKGFVGIFASEKQVIVLAEEQV